MPAQMKDITHVSQWIVSGTLLGLATKETRRCQSNSINLKEDGFAGGDVGDIGDPLSNSPQEIWDTMIELESPQESDDSEISPLSANLPQLRPASCLTRFYSDPSLLFSGVSPASAQRSMDRFTGSSVFERELEERVQIMYRSSTGVSPKPYASPGQNEVSRSSSGSDETLDSASSCYSRRTSITTLGSEFWGDDGRYPYKTADEYSIQSPISGGVFDDDAASLASPCSPSVEVLSRLGGSNIPVQLRPGPVTKKVSMNDLKNKPLPLEPSFGIISSSNDNLDYPLSAPSPRPKSHRAMARSQKESRGSPLQHSITMSHEDWKNSMLQHLNSRELQHTTQAWGHSQSKPPPRPRHTRAQSDNVGVAGPRARHVPSLSQAAEDLEAALAGLSDKDGSQKKQVVLDGPLQISRNGDLIATRPAPRPPSTKPHSQSPRGSPLSHLKRENRIRSVSQSPTKEKSHRLLKKESKEKARPPSRDTQTDAKPLISEAKNNANPKETNPRKEKLSKKSFLAFSRKQSQGLRDAVSVGSRSEHSLHLTEAHSSNPQDLAPTRNDLLLQLPRLQTNDLEGNPLSDIAGLDQPLSGSPGLRDMDCAARAEESAQASDNKLRQSWALVSTAQASSLHIPEQIYELAATPPSPLSALPSRVRKHDHGVEITLPEDLPVYLIFTIMEQIDSLDDLFNFVLVNKKIYTAFKRRELTMLKNALFKMSPPAWELREMSPPWEMEWQLLIDPDSQVPEYTPTLYLQRYAQDIYTLARLKALVLARCAPFLRRDTIRGLAGVDNKRAEDVDDAFWRIWTFCRIFGSGKGRENDITGQMDWLRGGVAAKGHFTPASTMTQPFGINTVLFEPPEGFGRGNLSGLSQKQMYDLTEIWTCLGVLLQPLHGKCIEARKVGIFDTMNVPDGDLVREEIILEEWTSYILTLGLGAVLTLSSVCATDTTVAKFTKANSIGLTKWDLTETEASRSSFLKEAVSRAYELQERTLESPTEISPQQTAAQSSPITETSREDRQRQARFARELRHRRERGIDLDPERRCSFSAERPMSEFSAIVRGLNGSLRERQPVPPVPALVLERSSTSTLGTAPHTPTYPSDPSPPYALSNTPPAPAIIAPVPLRPQVLDPVDRAIHVIVNELGFDAEDAKWALKITDTGEGIDAHAAVKLLQRQRIKNERNPFGQRDSLLSSAIRRQQSDDSGWRWA
ncbi:hypothetical protein N7457_006582 [Penicillium paradoxum]|uniref:uncharacterized protein n=1 Tax=Penicillium paradoxum TaxID=176176 RepID=UPI002547F1B4|nr:uncharacterized protein N7457_006582 [Penicillium paradoxum]KAJ5778862.1 hypothetical protein N7457_006582 [Penicillium paradoxum]